MSALPFLLAAAVVGGPTTAAIAGHIEAIRFNGAASSLESAFVFDVERNRRFTGQIWIGVIAWGDGRPGQAPASVDGLPSRGSCSVRRIDVSRGKPFVRPEKRRCASTLTGGRGGPRSSNIPITNDRQPGEPAASVTFHQTAAKRLAPRRFSGTSRSDSNGSPCEIPFLDRADERRHDRAVLRSHGVDRAPTSFTSHDVVRALQWSRVFSDAEIPATEWPFRGYVSLQWSRVFSDAEITAMASPTRAARGASMEPRLLRRGNCQHRRADEGAAESFNGAASSQTRKLQRRRRQRGRRVGLQWSRVFSDAEIANTVAQMKEQQKASMEPRLLRRGNGGCCGPRTDPGRASMEPRLLRRGNAALGGDIQLADRASMEPRLLRRRKSHGRRAADRSLTASMEPRLLRRGNGADLRASRAS
jgi:hypothetical protein